MQTHTIDRFVLIVSTRFVGLTIAILASFNLHVVGQESAASTQNSSPAKEAAVEDRASESTSSTPDCCNKCQTENCNEVAFGQPLPCECFAPDFYYQPGNKLIKGRYTRIQECQSKMIMRPGDEFWWVSCRHLPLKTCKFELCYYRFEDCQAKKSSMEELKKAHDKNPELYNFVYIHENRADLNKSELRFWQAYNILIRQAPNAPPVRFIFFTWPADQIRGQIRDVKTKGTVCDYHSYYMGWFPCQIKDLHKPSLGGYSYGCRLALDGLHIAAGGVKKCQALPKDMLITKPAFRGAFIATAMQNQCTPEGGLCDLTYSALDHVTFLNNSDDKVLKMFHRLTDNGASAIGREGICGVGCLPDGGKKLSQYDCHCITGKSHKLEDYFKSENLRQIIRDEIFWRN